MNYIIDIIIEMTNPLFCPLKDLKSEGINFGLITMLSIVL